MLSVLQNSNYFTNALPTNLFVKTAILLKYVHLAFVFLKFKFPVCNPNLSFQFNMPVNGIVSCLNELYIFLYSAYKHVQSPLIIEPAGV